MVGAWYFGCCQAQRGLPVGFLMLRYSVLFTGESLSLLYLIVISWFICFRRLWIDKLGVFHANQTSMPCSTSELRVGWRCETGLSPPVKYIYWPFQDGTSLWIIYVFFCLVFVMPLCASVYLCLMITFWKRADLLALRAFVVLDCIDSWSLHPYLHYSPLESAFLFPKRLYVTPIVEVCSFSLFCCTLLYVNACIAIIFMGKRELVALLNLSSLCLVMVERLFLAVPQGCLRFVIVVFPDHTHLLFSMKLLHMLRCNITYWHHFNITLTSLDFWQGKSYLCHISLLCVQFSISFKLLVLSCQPRETVT